jgi:feruloyl esterase
MRRRLREGMRRAHHRHHTGPSSIGGGAPEPPSAYRDAEHHGVSAVIKWVEEGVAPEKMVATKFASGALVRSRPTCVTPKLQERSIGPGDILHLQNSLRQRDVRLPNR